MATDEQVDRIIELMAQQMEMTQENQRQIIALMERIDARTATQEEFNRQLIEALRVMFGAVSQEIKALAGEQSASRATVQQLSATTGGRNGDWQFADAFKVWELFKKE